MRSDDLIQQFAPGAEAAGEETDARSLIGRRQLARVAAVQVLYQAAMTCADIAAVAHQFEEHRFGTEIDGLKLEVDRGFFRRLATHLTEDAHALVLLVQEAVSKRRVGQMEYVLQAILIAGAGELQALRDVPVKTVIDEYTEIAAAFFDEGERSLVNAVLDRLGRQLRGSEFEALSAGEA